MAELLLSQFVVLFIVVDPIGVAAMYPGLSAGEPAAYRQRMAWRAVLLAGGILVLFFLSGAELLRLLGIGVPAFRIAGGILLFLLAIDMIFARQSGLRSTTQRERQEAQHRQDISVFPLAFPLIAGPGALTTILLMPHDWSRPTLMLALLGILLAVLTMTLVALLLAARISRYLGETGVNVTSRLFGLILAALAAQYVLDGARTGWAGG